MKTSVIMTRKMGQFDVLQRTSDGMFNATALLNQWNKANPHDQRRIDNFWQSTHLDKLMSEIAENEYGFKSPNFRDLKNTLSRTTRGKYNGGTWMHPILFVKFAMYLNPRFEYHVLRFVSDELIKFRHSVGDNFNSLTRSLSTLPDIDYSRVARGMNWIIFNAHRRDIRNEASPSQLRELDSLQQKLAFSIDMGYVQTYPQLIESMRKIYSIKQNRF